MANFKVVELATLHSCDLWEGVVEYEGENVWYRFYDGYDEQLVYVFIEGEGWVFQGDKHPLINIIFAALKTWSCLPPDFGPVGETNEIDDETVSEYA